MPEHDKSIGENYKVIQRGIVKISSFVYSSVKKKHERFLLLLQSDQMEGLGLLVVVMNGTASYNGNLMVSSKSGFRGFKIAVTVIVLCI